MNTLKAIPIALAVALAVLTAGCQTLQTSSANPDGALFYKYVKGHGGVFYTVSGITFYELKGDRSGKFHTVGGTTYYNFGEGRSGHFQSLDGTSFYNFDEGAAGTFFTHDNGITEYGFGGSALKTSPRGTPSREGNSQESPAAVEEMVQTGATPSPSPLDHLETAPGADTPPEIAESTFYEDQ